MRKQANSKAIKKHMRNGGLNSFNFHSSPRMKVKDDNPVPVPAYKTKLTVAETDLLAKYFASTGEIAWRPSLIAFPHFQAFPSPVNKVDEDISDPCLRAEAVQPHCEIKEGSERSSDHAEEKLKTEELETDIELQKIAKDKHIEDFHKQKPLLHTFLFISEFVSVDDNGNVLVLSLPQLPVESNSKHTDGSKVQILVDSRLGNPDLQNGKLLSGAEEILYTPVSSRMPKEMDLYGTWNGDRGGDFTGPAFVCLPNLQSEVFMNSPKHDAKALEDDSSSKMDVPCSSDNEMQTPELQWKNNAPKTCTSPVPIAEEMQTPFARLSETSTSKDWLLDSEIKPETVEQQCKFRRLRKHGDLNRKIPPESKEQTEPSREHRTSRGTDYHTATKLVKGEEKRAKDATIYIEEEAEVSSEAMASDDEEYDQDNSSYEDSFIDDGTNPTSAGTQAGLSKTDMMAIYRINESGSSSGKHDPTPQTGLESTARNSQSACLEIPSEMADSKLESRKRKLSFYQAQSVPTVNLDKEFSLISEAPGKNSAMQIQAEKTEDNRDIFEDDQFYY
ncbi:UNVERIFIED_CONTAM: DEAD-box ATP-dependent RNA helicase FANCM [Sesamum radiatum]|uniref:DEAD-box ATP-dependent RNA helicase FANCM n=1 Tax=Sesamum radiatum TaxID=300843 RepID=A0AAW2PX18_SESRA